MIDSQASEPVPPDELPYLDDNRKLPAVVQKTDIDESVRGDSTELCKDVTINEKN